LFVIFRAVPEPQLCCRRPFVSSRFYSVRANHLSNADIKKPNIGLNTYLINVGYSRLF
jgi:hypothetical protein